VGAATLSGILMPSRIDKTAANLWGSFVEYEGTKVVKEYPRIGVITFYMGGLTLAPGGTETYYDHIVKRSHEVKASQLAAERWHELVAIYFEHLSEIAAGGAWGLRQYMGDILLVCFVLQIFLALILRRPGSLHSLAFAASALAFYFGPVVLLRGDEATHYLLVMVPLVVLVAAQGIAQVGQIIWDLLKRSRPVLVERLGQVGPSSLVMASLFPIYLSVTFYQGALLTIQDFEEKADREQVDLDALELQGRKVACRNMTWFVDRDVETVLLPYATVPKLERYVLAQKVDGILVWTKEPSPFFYATPYGKLSKFDRALRSSPLFGPPQVSGHWRWYPVRPAFYPRRGS
jgi:hypothetical protein